jgi:hypothetical protein
LSEMEAIRLGLPVVQFFIDMLRHISDLFIIARCELRNLLKQFAINWLRHE